MKKPLHMAVKVANYLSYRRSLGYELKWEGKALVDFGHYADQSGHRGPLTLALALKWARLPTEAAPSYWARRLAILRGLAKYLQLEEPDTEVPPVRILGPACRRKAPHIYSAKEIAHLMGVAQRPRQGKGLQPLTLCTVIGLLASTGMRISEALRLRVADVDLKNRIITVRESKFHRSRLIPLHTTVVAKLTQYHKRRQRDLPGSESFFVTQQGTALPYGIIQRAFHELVEDIPSRGGRPRPRLHDLRHTYACRILIRWNKHPTGFGRRILWLMHYLGHTHISRTYWYLPAVPELLAGAAAHFEEYAKRLAP